MDGAVLGDRGTAPWRVMVVDDEDMVRLTLSDLLELSGYRVCGQARDGYEAARLARTANPDIILMDIVMPDMDGIEALHIINAARPTCALVLSAHGSQSLAEQAQAAGAQGYLMKPCRQAELVPAVEAAIERFACSRVAIETRRVEALFERAWSHVAAGGSLDAAAERALVDSCQLAGYGAHALVARRGARLWIRAARGMGNALPGGDLGPARGPLGDALSQRSPCQVRLEAAPAHLASVLCASVPAVRGFRGCLCLFAPDGHRFGAREEQLAAAAARALARLLRRAQEECPRAWQAWQQWRPCAMRGQR